MAAKLIIEIVADASQAKKELTHTTSDVEKLGASGSVMGKALMAGAAAGAAGLVALGVSAFNAAAESAKIGRETERVIKTIGAASWTSAAQVEELAGAISDKTGADDEAIQSGANLLLTFANVKNEVGEGNDVFDQATGLALDMATALGTDMSGAAVQLGKALNDPLKGITALSKAGVSFTEDQKAQIKLMAESGDLLGAQKIVLAELSKEFKGAAEAAGTPLDKLMVAAGNLQEEIGAKLIPAVDAVASVLLSSMGPALETVSGFVTEHTELLKYLGGVALVALAGAYGPVVAAQALLVGQGLVGWVTSVIGYMGALGAVFLETAASEGILAAATGALELTMLPVIAAVAALGAVVYAVSAQLDTSSESADRFWEAIQEDVDVSSYESVAEGSARTKQELDALQQSVKASQGSWGDIGSAVADTLVPFHDVENSLDDQYSKLVTLNDAHTAQVEAVNKTIAGLKEYATAQAQAAHASEVTAQASLSNLAVGEKVDAQVQAMTVSMLKIAEAKKIDLTSQDAVDRVTAMYEQTQFATTSTLGMSDAQEKFNDAASTAKDKVDAYKLSLDALIGAHLGAAQAETAYSDNSLNLIKTLNENRAVTNGLLDVNQAKTLEQAAAVNESNKAIQGNVKSAMDLANATYQETGSLEQATGSLAVNRQALIDTMVQSGYTREAAEAYIDRLGLTPDNISTQVNLDNKQATGALDHTQGQLDQAAKGADGKVTMDTGPAERELSGFERLLANFKNNWSSSLGSLIGLVARADGGPVLRGQPYMVGERGPELFVPRTGGAIIPAGMTARLGGQASGNVTNINITIPNTGLGIDSPKLQRDLVGALQRYTAREGPFSTSQALGGSGAGSQGPPGPQGEAGPAGPEGPQGDPGPAGAASTVPGPQGPKGDTGSTGATGATGAAGPQGIKGDTGAQGIPGTPGATGSQGPKGDTGAQGIQGVKGDKGDPGATGSTGPAGVGIPAGGTTGQQAVKTSNADYAVSWSTETFKWK
jgi:hypothetical protein